MVKNIFFLEGFSLRFEFLVLLSQQITIILYYLQLYSFILYTHRCVALNWTYFLNSSEFSYTQDIDSNFTVYFIKYI